MEKPNDTAAANALPDASSTSNPLELTYESTAPYMTDGIRQILSSGAQLARATRVGFFGAQHLMMGILSSESPIIREVRAEFMITPAELWPELLATLPINRYIMMCRGDGMTPPVKRVCAAAIQRAHDANRKARPADFLFHVFEFLCDDVRNVLADFDLVQAPVVSFIRSHEHLEPPMPPDPLEPPAPRPEPRVWKSATDRYADWRLRAAAQSPPKPPSE